jgi:hypothetical protein
MSRCNPYSEACFKFFSIYPTIENFIIFKCLWANAKRTSWETFVSSTPQSTHLNTVWKKIQYMSVCMYVYSRGGPQTAPAPRPFLIYCALHVSKCKVTSIAGILVGSDTIIFQTDIANTLGVHYLCF